MPSVVSKNAYDNETILKQIIYLQPSVVLR